MSWSSDALFLTISPCFGCIITNKEVIAEGIQGLYNNVGLTPRCKTLTIKKGSKQCRGLPVLRRCEECTGSGSTLPSHTLMQYLDL